MHITIIFKRESGCCDIMIYLVGQGVPDIQLGDGDYMLSPYPHNIMLERKEVFDGKDGSKIVLLAPVNVFSNRPSKDLDRICEFQVKGNGFSGDRLTNGKIIELSDKQKTYGLLVSPSYIGQKKEEKFPIEFRYK